MEKKYNLDNLSSFLDSISSSNLETLHSKAIAWLLNLPNTQINLKDFFRSSIFELEEDSEVEHIVSLAEVASHDLISLLIVEKEFRLVIWENKIKADFHQKMKSQLPYQKQIELSDYVKSLIDKTLEKYQKDWLRGISQPYWYQIRWLLWKLHSGNEIKEKILTPLIKNISNNDSIIKINNLTIGRSGHKSNKDHELASYIYENMKVDWVILSPHEEENIKIFNNSKWNGLKFIGSDNDSEPIKGDTALLKGILEIAEHDSLKEWKFITYQVFLKQIQSLNENGVAREYLKYLNIHKDFIRVSNSENNSQESRVWDLEQLLEIYGKLRSENFDFEWLASGSERNGHPLLNIIISSIKLSDVNTQILEKILDIHKVKNSKMNGISIKLQIQGAVKLQFAHCAYHHVRFKNTKEPKKNIEDYKVFVFKLLFQMFTNNSTSVQLNSWENITEKKQNFDSPNEREEFIKEHLSSNIGIKLRVTENTPSSKTGLSYTIKNADKTDLDSNDIIKIIHSISAFANKSNS